MTRWAGRSSHDMDSLARAVSEHLTMERILAPRWSSWLRRAASSASPPPTAIRWRRPLSAPASRFAPRSTPERNASYLDWAAAPPPTAALAWPERSAIVSSMRTIASCRLAAAHSPGLPASTTPRFPTTCETSRSYWPCDVTNPLTGNGRRRRRVRAAERRESGTVALLDCGFGQARRRHHGTERSPK
mgnify:CR=1 FL=1